MATHSNILAWKIPWTEEPGRLQPMGLQRVRPDRALSLSLSLSLSLTHTHTHTHTHTLVTQPAENPPPNAGDLCLTPGPGRSHVLQSN